MKKIAKILALMLVVSMLVVSMVALTACTNDNETVVEKNISIYVFDQKYDVTTTEEFLMDAFVALAEDKGLTYSSSHSAYGHYITSLGDYQLVPENNEFIQVIHTMDDLKYKMFDTYLDSWEIELNDKTFYISGLGISSLPLVDGHSYGLRVGNFIPYVPEV